MANRFEYSYRGEPDPGQIKVFGPERMAEVVYNEATIDEAGMLFNTIEAVCSDTGKNKTILRKNGIGFRLIEWGPVDRREILSFHTNPNEIRVQGYGPMYQALASVNWLERGTIAPPRQAIFLPRIEYNFREGIYIDHYGQAIVEREISSPRKSNRQYTAYKPATSAEVEKALQIIVEAVAFDDAAIGQRYRGEI